jgi:DNA-binding NarL/FixJ family response regulator
MIRILLVDDDPMVCEHLQTILTTADDMAIVDIAHDGAEAIDSVTRLRPDVVLMDLRMPGVDGITATRHITALRQPPVVVALTTFDSEEDVLSAMAAGAAGYLLKSTPPQDLIGLVRVAADGHTVMSSAATKQLLHNAVRNRADERTRARIETLTGREREVLAGLGKGLSNGQIARRLFLSEATVKGHVSRILVKLDCANRAQAALVMRGFAP